MTRMRALQLDYQRGNKPIPWLGWVVLIAALAALTLMGAYYQALTQRIAFWEQKVDHLERQSSHRAPAVRPFTEQEERAQLLEVKQANLVVHQLAMPWNALFRAVEISAGKDVALLSLEPDAQKGMVKISGEAKDFNALLHYVRQLSKREVFGNVFLQNHTIQQSDPQKPLRFSLLAYWKGGAP